MSITSLSAKKHNMLHLQKGIALVVFMIALVWGIAAKGGETDGNSFASFEHGNTFFKLHDFENAERLYKKALLENPSIAWAHHQLGRVYFAQSRLQEAKEEFTMEISFHPESINAFYMRGLTYTFLEDLSKAEEDFRTYIGLNSQSEAGHNDLAQVLFAQGKFKEAEKELLKILEVSEKSFLADQGLGAVYIEFGEYGKAQEYLEKALTFALSMDKDVFARYYPSLNPEYAQEGIKIIQEGLKHNLGLAQVGERGDTGEMSYDIKSFTPYFKRSLSQSKGAVFLAACCDAAAGNLCSACNVCGSCNSGSIQCDGSCSESVAPALPAGYGDSCQTCNACGTCNTGTIQCNGTCSALAPANPVGYGNSCTSCNNAGVCNTGTIQCNGTCSAVAPANYPTTVSLGASSNNVSPSTSVTLTAITDYNVGSTPYYIRIYEGVTQLISCSSGASCSIPVTSSVAATRTFTAKVERFDQTDVRATDSASVTWVNPWSVSLGASPASAVVYNSIDLTATANQTVTGTLYYIRIYEGATQLVSCPSGMTCSTSVSSTFATTRTFTAKIERFDGSDIQATGSTSAVWTADTTPPSSTILSPSVGSWQTSPSFSVSIFDSDSGSGLQTCAYIVYNNGSLVRADSRTPCSGSSSSSSATINVGGSDCTVNGTNTCEIRVYAVDRAGNSSSSSPITRQFSIDYSQPSVGSVTPTTATKNVATTFSVPVSDQGSGALSCTFWADGVNQGGMTLSQTPCTNCTATKSHTFATTGNHPAYALCADALNPAAQGPTTTIAVAEAFCSAPVLDGGYNNDDVTVKWNQVPGATQYFVWEDSGKCASNPSRCQATVAGPCDPVLGCQRTFFDLSDNQSFTWKARVTTSDGTCIVPGIISNPLTFSNSLQCDTASNTHPSAYSVGSCSLTLYPAARDNTDFLAGRDSSVTYSNDQPEWTSEFRIEDNPPPGDCNDIRFTNSVSVAMPNVAITTNAYNKNASNSLFTGYEVASITGPFCRYSFQSNFAVCHSGLSGPLYQVLGGNGTGSSTIYISYCGDGQTKCGEVCDPTTPGQSTCKADCSGWNDITNPDPPPNVRSTSHFTSNWKNDRTIDVTWDAATDPAPSPSGIRGYLYIWDSSSVTVPDAATAIETPGLTNTSSPLSDGNSHYFHIRSVDNANNLSTTVHLGPFWIDGTDPPTPSRVSPTDGSTTSDTTPTFSWNSVSDLSGITNYWLQVDNNSDYLSPEVNLRSNVTSHTPSTALADGTYFWRVRSEDTAFNTSAWSSTNWTVIVQNTASSCYGGSGGTLNGGLNGLSCPPGSPSGYGIGLTLCGSMPTYSHNVSCPQSGTYSCPAGYTSKVAIWYKTELTWDVARIYNGGGAVLENLSGTSASDNYEWRPYNTNTLKFDFSSDGSVRPDPGGFNVVNIECVPFAPSIPDLAASSDTGSSSTDNITNDTTPTFTGTGPAGATIKILRDGVEQTPTATVSAGSWSVSLSMQTPGSSINYTAQACHGTTCSPSSGALPVTIDIAVPGNATALTSGSHVLSTWSNDTTVDVSWTAAADTGGAGLDGYSVVWDTSAATLPGATKDIGTVTSYTSPSLANGNSHYFHIRSVDKAGNWATEAVHLGPFWVDATAPLGPTGLGSSSHTTLTWSSDRTVDVFWTAATDAHSGLDGYSYAWDTNATTTPDTVKDIEEISTTNTSPSLGDGNSHYFHIRPRDNADNWGSAVHLGPFWIETTPPSGSISINSNASYATSTSVTLALSCSDSSSGCSKMKFSNDNVSFTAEENYAASKPWTLTSGDGSKTVYVQFKDGAGNWSTSFNDSIILDTARPRVESLSAPSLIPSGGSATISWRVTDSAGGSHLKWVEIWRTSDSGGAPNPGGWGQVGPNYNAPAGSDDWSSSTTDSPPNGTWWYGIHVPDNAGWVSTESDPPNVGPKKVIVNSPPSANFLSSSQLTPCAATGADLPTFSWTYTDADGHSMSQFQVQVWTSGFGSLIQDFGVQAGTTCAGCSFSFRPTSLGSVTQHVNYSWKLTVWDSQGSSSGQINSPSTFQLHSYPTSQFTYTPQNPSVGEPVQFTETSQIRDQGASKFAGALNFRWVFQDGTPAQTEIMDPSVTFSNPNDKSKDITLKVQDTSGHQCQETFTASTGVNLKSPLPKFFPVIPF